MDALRIIAGWIGLICLTTPVWYTPYRRVVERLGLFKDKRGRVREASRVDWLNATGVGIFLGSLLSPFVMSLFDSSVFN